MTSSIGNAGKAALVLGIAVIIAVVLYLVGTQYATISILIVVLGLIATILQITGFSLRDLRKKQLKPDSPGVAPPAIKEAIRVGGLVIEREFRGAEAVLQYRDGTSRLLIKQLKPEADEISDAARLVSLGQFGEAQTKASEAIKLLEGAKLEEPLRLLAESYLIQGDAAFGKGLHAEAERFYSASYRLAIVVDDRLLVAAAARGVGIAKGSQGRHKDALDAFNEVLKLDPKNVSAWISKGMALGGLGRYEDALHAYDEALKLDPKNVTAWNSKGLTLGNLGRYEDALRASDEVLKLYPKNADAWINKGMALGILGRYEDALRASDEVLKLYPKNADAWINKGLALGSLGRYEDALDAFDVVLRLDPKNANAWNSKGHALADLGRYEDALHACDEALKLDPKYANAWNNKGMVLAKLGKHEDALHAFDEYLKLNPKDANAWNSRGEVLSYLGRNGEALASADKALQIDPILRRKKTKKVD